MLNFKLSPEIATYISTLLAERPIKEAGQVALDWQKQGDAEVLRLNAETDAAKEAEIRAKIAAETPVIER